MNKPATGVVVSIAIKRERGAPMQEVTEATVSEENGLDGNVPQQERRRVTLIGREGWEAAQAELGGNLPWHTRRANILVEGLDLGSLIGKSIRVGEIELAINGETEPCGQMDIYQPGLQNALKPDCRGGIYGSILKSGRVKAGDTVAMLPESNG